jgi:hypothetical protein
MGCDIMSINVELCRKRLSCGNSKYLEILTNNIIIGNALDCITSVENQTDQDQLRMIELFGGDYEALIEKIHARPILPTTV